MTKLGPITNLNFCATDQFQVVFNNHFRDHDF